MGKPLATLASAVVALLCSQAARADTGFTDPAGDAGGSPDITEVTVANDAEGRIVFRVAFAGGAPLPRAGDVAIYVDADEDGSTGESGRDYRIVLNGLETWSFSRWDGFEWRLVPALTGRAYFLPGAVMFAVDRSELGGTTSFELFVLSGLYENGELVAADGGEADWTYETVAKTLGLTATPVVAVTRGGARAGRVFLAGYTFARSDSPEPANGTRTRCVATVAGRRLGTRVSQAADTAACLVTPPKASRGKLLRLTLTTSFGAVAVTRTYAARVRA